jgi:hypothetical protein
MESEKFDALIRKLNADESRRGVARAGLSAVASSVLVSLGLHVDDAAAKKKKNKKKKNKGVAAAICSGARPITCGSGCCPPNFPTCCQNFFFANSPDTCNPPGAVCCPTTGGFTGGSCGGALGDDHTKCCPATPLDPFGDCAEPGATCCNGTPAEGGGHCDPPDTKCCANDCCLPNQSCCGPAGPGQCPVGTTCDGGPGDCCVPTMMLQAERVSRSVRSSRKHYQRPFHMAAQ